MMPTVNRQQRQPSAPKQQAQQQKQQVQQQIQFVLTNKRCIEFYSKNPHIDFNTINEMFIDLFHKLTSSGGNIFRVDEMKNALMQLDKKISTLDNNISQNNTMIKMTNDNLNNKLVKDNIEIRCGIIICQMIKFQII